MQRSGLYFLLEGFKLILKPGIKRFVLIPFILNVIILIALFALMNHFVTHFTGWINQFLPSWLQWLGDIIWLLFLVSFGFITIYFFVTLANIVGAPFNNLLSEKIELHLRGKSLMPEHHTLTSLLKSIPVAIGRQLSILGYYLPKALLLFLLFFIPILQLAATPLWFLFSAWFMTLQMLDYPTDNHHVPLKTVMLQLKQKRWLALTFGVSVLLFAMIPVLNLLVIPAAVAGATKMWVEEF